MRDDAHPPRSHGTIHNLH